MIEGILFDMDGVLIDSEPIILRAAHAFFARRGITTREEDFQPFVGAGDRRYLEGVGERYGLTLDFDRDRTELYELYAQAVQEAVSFDGVHDFFFDAKRAGFKVGLATGSERHKALINLAAIGLKEEDFDTVVTGEQVVRNKPYPDIYQLTALSMGLSPEVCLVVEDSIHGVVSAKRACCAVLSLPNSFSSSALAEAGSDVVLDTLSDFGRFSTIEAFNARLKQLIVGNTVVYGANRIDAAPTAITPQLFDEAVAAALESWRNAYAPYSQFKVGAALVSAKSGKVYSGCNVENSSYGATVCAERNAVLHSIAEEGVVGIDLLVVVSDDDPPAPPCALCLQVLSEFCRPETEVHLVDIAYAERRDGVHEVYRFGELLPHPFIFPAMRQL
ncbi:MAG TPA: cytidine deaminase [Sphaerochaeta sp.]|jgi:homotetrameric cytidine deaminase|nr:cytidine deaminase [Spirochaetota bacterium]NLV60108.1 cytidine deaminase [Spirochaetales bacterium]HOE83893.1 cytidine deaminase [Sphaerochaeta sp.]HOQ93857.1 cytidine deaminase [Sphaerochaeta sp.]HPK46288.1 cytidine deaminase [Sphaerochaeta sp.]